MKDLVIVVPVYNRKRTVEISLSNLSKYKQNSTLWVYDDCSTEFGPEFLAGYADKLVMGHKNLGVHGIRWKQLHDFIESDFKYIYLTDSDSFHDPNFLNVLKGLPKGNPISLYTSDCNAFISKKETFKRKWSGGISHFYTREMIEDILERAKNIDKKDGWDYKFPQLLKKEFLVTRTSYLDHLGAYGIHSGDSWDHDRAKNPTEFLRTRRAPYIDYVEGKASSYIL
jgi:glycosyltransferase involved in cell wall biosynthesis